MKWIIWIITEKQSNINNILSGKMKQREVKGISVLHDQKDSCFLIGSGNLDMSLCLLEACQILPLEVNIKRNTKSPITECYCFDRCLISTFRQLKLAQTIRWYNKLYTMQSHSQSGFLLQKHKSISKDAPFIKKLVKGANLVIVLAFTPYATHSLPSTN